MAGVAGDPRPGAPGHRHFTVKAGALRVWVDGMAFAFPLDRVARARLALELAEDALSAEAEEASCRTVSD